MSIIPSAYSCVHYSQQAWGLTPAKLFRTLQAKLKQFCQHRDNAPRSALHNLDTEAEEARCRGEAPLIDQRTLASIILLVWGVFSVLPSVGRLVAKSFWCPFRERNVTAEFTEEAWGGTPVEVSRCSVFTPPTSITCDKLCLQLKKLPERTIADAIAPSESLSRAIDAGRAEE